ncbi:MAG TPA: hypothetical protein VLG25_02915 [Patescibacteria group bacterium]|nr:hypothetical protein [Patescibacteria group bacterium]
MFGHNDNNQDEQNQDTQAQISPVVSNPVDDGLVKQADSPATSPPVSAPSSPLENIGSDSDVMSTPPSDDLVSLKQEALHQLTPLVGHLDQTPEEKFRTLMMMIQATDDSTKLKEAFDSAKQITDDKVRAQALLDVVNEINYFTQHNAPAADPA